MNEWKKVGAASSWNYAEEGVGATVQGVYLTKEENVGENHSNVYTIETKNGLVSVWGSSVLDSKFKVIQPGDEIKIKYLGKAKSEKTNREYHDFDVEYREPDGTPNGDIKITDKDYEEMSK